jgi:hypothetical protein
MSDPCFHPRARVREKTVGVFAVVVFVATFLLLIPPESNAVSFFLSLLFFNPLM